MGKDTASNFLFRHLITSGLKVEKRSFARSLKIFCHQLYKWDGLQGPDYYEVHPELREVPLPTIGKSPRQIWIEVSQNLKSVYPNTWVDLFFQNLNTNASILIITDLRFYIEINAVKKRNGFLWKVHNPNVSSPDTDPAQIELDSFDGWDEVLINDGTLDDLNNKVIATWEKNFGKP